VDLELKKTEGSTLVFLLEGEVQKHTCGVQKLASDRLKRGRRGHAAVLKLAGQKTTGKKNKKNCKILT